MMQDKIFAVIRIAQFSWSERSWL